MFSRSVFTVFTAGLAALASAYTTPKGDPSGNPTSKPGLGEIVPVGTPYAITWDPTTTGTISILLLRGPSTNVVPIATIVEGIANTGTYEWTPSTSLEPDTTHYGIQLIVDGTGQYQYSPQFGVSNPSYSSSASSAVATTSSVAMSVASSSSAIVSAASVASTTPCTTTTSAKASVWTANSTSHWVGTGTGTAWSSHATATGTGASNHSVIYPSKSMTVPSSLLTTVTAAGSSAAAASSAVATGAAGHVKAGLGLAGAIAGLVMAL